MLKEYKTVREIKGPLVFVDGVDGAAYEEIVEVKLPDGDIRKGKVLEVDGDKAVIQMFASPQGVGTEGSVVRFLGRQSVGLRADLAAIDDVLP